MGVIDNISAFVLALMALWIMVKLIKSVRIVPQRYAYVVERLAGTMPP